jgi:hypothetical protein
MPAPIPLGLTPHRRCFGVFDFRPMRRAPGAIGGAEPLRYNTLASEPARLAEHDCAISRVTLVHDDGQMRAVQQLCEPPLARLDRLAPQIVAVELKQIERAMHGTADCAVAADQIKNGKPVLIANDSFAVDGAWRPSNRYPMTNNMEGNCPPERASARMGASPH